MSSYSSNVNSFQTCNSLDVLKFKNWKCMECEEIVVVRILETDASKNKLFYKCDDKSCENTFIDWWKPYYIDGQLHYKLSRKFQHYNMHDTSLLCQVSCDAHKKPHTFKVCLSSSIHHIKLYFFQINTNFCLAIKNLIFIWTDCHHSHMSRLLNRPI